MIVACPSCETKFNVPDEKYAPGRKARCSSCAHVFPLPELTGTALDISAVSVALPVSAPPVALVTANAAAQPVVQLVTEDDFPFPEPDDVVMPAKGGAFRVKGVKGIALIGVAVCLLAVLGYGGYKVFSSFGKPPAVAPAINAKEAAQQELVKHLALENVRQYIVTNNEKVGRMVVVEGKVVNNFTGPKELILLEVTLYDDKGKPVAARQQYCGITLSLFQLQILSKLELEEALKNQVEILTHNTNILPKKEVPFITVFFNPPDTTYEFGVKIVDVKNPAPKQ